MAPLGGSAGVTAQTGWPSAPADGHGPQVGPFPGRRGGRPAAPPAALVHHHRGVVRGGRSCSARPPRCCGWPRPAAPAPARRVRRPAQPADPPVVDDEPLRVVDQRVRRVAGQVSCSVPVACHLVRDLQFQVARAGSSRSDHSAAAAGGPARAVVVRWQRLRAQVDLQLVVARPPARCRSRRCPPAAVPPRRPARATGRRSARSAPRWAAARRACSSAMYRTSGTSAVCVGVPEVDRAAARR